MRLLGRISQTCWGGMAVEDRGWGELNTRRTIRTHGVSGGDLGGKGVRREAREESTQHTIFQNLAPRAWEAESRTN